MAVIVTERATHSTISPSPSQVATGFLLGWACHPVSDVNVFVPAGEAGEEPQARLAKSSKFPEKTRGAAGAPCEAPGDTSEAP